MAIAVKSPVTEYAQAVLHGDILTGKLVKLACQRHMDDLTRKDLYFDEEKAQGVINFFAHLDLPDGQNAGLPFYLEPWEAFIAGSLIGWYKKNRRRYQYAYIEIARANGKTPFGAGMLLYGLAPDDERGAQCYSAATTRDQAKIAFRDCATMVNATPQLKDNIIPLVNNLTYKPLGSFLRPLSSDASKMDGLRVHFALADELHEHPNGDVIHKLRTGMKSSKPMLIEITTAGYDRETICWEEHDYSAKVVEGVLPDDARFVYIATLDEGDDWTDERVWPKSNPNLGVTVDIDTLRQECEQAKQIPGHQNAFKRLRLNIWTEQAERWLDMGVWDSQPPKTRDLSKQRCYAGLDLSSTIDLTALVLDFPDLDGFHDVMAYFWMPEERIAEKVRQDRVPYDVWVREGWIIATPGNVVDYDYIRAEVSGILNDGRKRPAPCLSDTYDIIELAKDRWNSTQIGVQLLGDGVEVVDFGQGFASMTAPAKELERLLLDKRLRHGNNPVLRWMAANVAVMQDPAGNLKPAKDKSTGRIDGIVAECMALGSFIRHESEGSIYELREMLVL